MDKQVSRIKNSKRNVIFSVFSYGLLVVLEFASRTVFIMFLSQNYLGIQGLFSNMLTFLSLAEMGVGTAISYALYKPLAENDYEKIKSIMRLYKKMYNIIGMIVLSLGLCLTPFLSFFIKNKPNDISNLELYFVLFVVNSACSYFLIYKKTIIISDQKEYITSIISSIVCMLRLSGQIIVVYVTHSYLLYILMMIVGTLSENIIISIYANKKYRYLKDTDYIELDNTTKKDIKKNIFAMFFHKIGTVVVNATDNIVISKFIGLSVVGIYSNYLLVVNALSTLISKFFSSITASVGNLAVSEKKEYVETVFYRIFFLNAWVRIVPAACLYCLLQGFIKVWIGTDYLLNFETVIMIVLCFYLRGIRSTVLVFRDVTGLFWYDRYKPLIESAVNLCCSVPLAIRYGVTGVLLGTVISIITVSAWVEPYVLFKFFFEKNMIKYFKMQILYFIELILICRICELICSLISGATWMMIIFKGGVCFILANILFILFNMFSDYLKYYISLVFKKG